MDIEILLDISFFKSNRIADCDGVDKSASRRIKSANRSRKEIAFGRFYTIVYLLFQFLSLASRRHRRSRFAVGGVCSFFEPPATKLKHILPSPRNFHSRFISARDSLFSSSILPTRF